MKERKDLGLSYREAMHGVQTAIAHAMSGGDYEATMPKHLRVGVDSAHVSQAALVDLLVAKAVFTMDEYLESLRLCANDELARWEGENPRVRYR
jgi:hypothetical protein